MIAKVALMFVQSAWGRYLVGAFAVLAAATIWGASKKRSGRKEARQIIENDIADATQRGRDAYRENKRNPDGHDPDVVLDRMRGRDVDWRGL